MMNMPTDATEVDRGREVLDTIRNRRVVRNFSDEPVLINAITSILEAGRWASSASNRRIHRYLVVRDQRRLSLTRKLSPGMATVPPLLIVVCTDLRKMESEGVQDDRDRTTQIDVGTAAMNMMIAAEAIGLGSCPVTSFSQSGVSTVLGLPKHIRPELLLMIGHRKPESLSRLRERLRLRDISDWEYIGGELEEDSH